MGLISAIIGWLQYHLGLRTDAASSSGSLHGKMAELRADYLPTELPKLQKPRGYGSCGHVNLNSVSWATALNLTGRGCLRWLYLIKNTGVNANVRITVDGKVLSTGATDPADASASGPFQLFPAFSSTKWILATSSPLIPINLEFKSSLKIEVYGNGYIDPHWYCELE